MTNQSEEDIMVRYKYNPEHHHDESDKFLFTTRSVHDETFWEVLEPDCVDNIDVVVVRVMHGDQIAYYTDLEDYMKAWFDEGYFHSAEMGQLSKVHEEFQYLARSIGYEIPARWMEGQKPIPPKEPDITLPWGMVVGMFRMHLLHSFMKQGKSIEESNRLVDDAILNPPTAEMITLISSLVVGATVQYQADARKRSESRPGILREHIFGERYREKVAAAPRSAPLPDEDGK